MDGSPKHLRVFLSSPSDVAIEREMTLTVLNQLENSPLLQGLVTLQVVAWDKPGAGVPMLATMTPQEAINRGLPKPSDCDIVVVILWARIGTPLAPEFTKPDGTRYLSGTEWEYEDALQADRKPAILVYRRMDEVRIEPNDPQFLQKYEQVSSVHKFFQNFHNPDGSIRRSYSTYTKPDEFSGMLEQNLEAVIRDLLEDKTDTKTADRMTPKVREQVQTHLFVGDRLAAQKKYEEALAQYENALAIDQGNIEVRRRLVSTRRDKLLWEEFGPHSRIRIALNHDHDRWRVVPQSEIDAALIVLYQCQALNPTLKQDVGLLLDEALILKTDRRLGEAIEVLRQAHGLAPGNAEVLAELGLLLAFFSQGSQQIAEGIAYIRRAIESEPNEARYHFYLAHALAETCFCRYAGLEYAGTDDAQAQACAEAIREYHRAADRVVGNDIWEIRRSARRYVMDIFHCYARKEGDILTPKLAIPFDERLKALQYSISEDYGGSDGWHDNPRFWLVSLLYATGNLEQADRKIRELLEKAHSGFGRNKNYWEDQYYIGSMPLGFELFVKILEERGSDPTTLATVKRLMAEARKGSPSL
jgi:tetratricopeptide (TPR) repeat protein